MRSLRLSSLLSSEKYSFWILDVEKRTWKRKTLEKLIWKQIIYIVCIIFQLRSQENSQIFVQENGLPRSLGSLKITQKKFPKEKRMHPWMKTEMQTIAILTATSITSPRQLVAIETAVATAIKATVMITWRMVDLPEFSKKPTSIT